MSHYHYSVKIVSRSNGSNIVRKAAYNSRSKLADKSTKKSFDFKRKGEVLFSDILIPNNAPDWLEELVQSREDLWSSIERCESRKDSQLAREVVVALPHSIAFEAQKDLLLEFITKEFVARGMVADVSIHPAPEMGDQRNRHAHILLTTRAIDAEQFGKKKRSWNEKQLLRDWRQSWALKLNEFFIKLGSVERVDHRSLADQGVNREPEKYKGLAITEQERKKVKNKEEKQKSTLRRSTCRGL